MLKVYEVKLDHKVPFGRSSDSDQRSLDNIILDQIEKAKHIILSHSKESSSHRICNSFISSVSWTDTDRDTTFTSDPTALVLKKDDVYCGHVYVWISGIHNIRETHVIGIRKSISLIVDKSDLKVMPLLIKAAEDWSLRHDIKIIRIQDPLSNTHAAFVKLGYELTARWHDLSVNRSLEDCYKSDMIKTLV